MKAITSKRGMWFCKSVRLFRGDIEALIELMSTPESRAQLSDGRHEFESIDEMQRERGDTIKDLNITNGSGNLSLSLSQRVRMLHGESDVSRFYQVRDFLEARPRPLDGLVQLLGYCSLPALALALLLVLSHGNVKPGRGRQTDEIALVVYSVVFNPFRGIPATYGCRISLRRRHESSFWRRKKDDLLMLLVGSMVGTILGIVGTLVVQHLTKKQP